MHTQESYSVVRGEKAMRVVLGSNFVDTVCVRPIVELDELSGEVTNPSLRSPEVLKSGTQ